MQLQNLVVKNTLFCCYISSRIPCLSKMKQVPCRYGQVKNIVYPVNSLSLGLLIVLVNVIAILAIKRHQQRREKISILVSIVICNILTGSTIVLLSGYMIQNRHKQELDIIVWQHSAPCWLIGVMLLWMSIARRLLVVLLDYCHLLITYYALVKESLSLTTAIIHAAVIIIFTFVFSIVWISQYQDQSKIAGSCVPFNSFATGNLGLQILPSVYIAFIILTVIANLYFNVVIAKFLTRKTLATTSTQGNKNKPVARSMLINSFINAIAAAMLPCSVLYGMLSLQDDGDHGIHEFIHVINVSLTCFTVPLLYIYNIVGFIQSRICETK